MRRRGRFRPIHRLLAALLGWVLLLGLPLPAALGQVQLPGCGTQSYLRFVNVSPDAGGIDLYVNDQLVVSNLTYPNAAASIPVATGTVRIRANRTGREKVILSPREITVPAGSEVTLFVVGQALAGGEGQQPATPTLSTVGTPGSMGATTTDARITVAATSDLGAVDVLVNGSRVVSNLVFASVTGLIYLTAGRYDLQLTRSGTNETLTGPITIDLEAGHSYTLYTTGRAADRTLGLSLLVDRAFESPTREVQVRFVHAAPQTAPLDFYLGGRLVVSNLAYPNATPYVPVSTVDRCVGITLTGLADAIFPTFPLSFEGADRWTVVVMGIADSSTGLVVGTYHDLGRDRSAPGYAALRVIHASPDVGAVDMVFASDGTVFETEQYGSASSYRFYSAGTWSLGWNRAGTSERVLGPIDLTLSGGQDVTLILRGTLADQSLGLTLLSDVSPP